MNANFTTTVILDLLVAQFFHIAINLIDWIFFIQSRTCHCGRSVAISCCTGPWIVRDYFVVPPRNDILMISLSQLLP